MKKLKILMLTEDYLPIYGGITSVVDKLSKGLHKFGLADITIGTVDYDKEKHQGFSDDGNCCKILRCKGKYNKITTNMSAQLSDKSFTRAIESQKYDVIHCHFPLKLYKYGLKLGKKTKTPVVISCHGIFYPDMYNATKSKLLATLATRYVTHLLNKADSVWSVTNFCKNYLLKFGLTNKANVVYNAVDFDTNNSALDFDVRKHYGIERDDFVIISVGRLVKIKNNDLTIKAIALIKTNRPDNKIKHLIIGDGQEKSNLMKLAKSLGVEDQCIFAGAVSDRSILSRIYESCDLVAFPSTGDSAGLIQVEAAYFNKPTLAIENTAISELMQDGINGIIATTDINNYADKVIHYYDNKKLLLDIGENAHKTIFRSYSDEKTIKVIYDEYLRVIDNYKSKTIK